MITFDKYSYVKTIYLVDFCVVPLANYVRCTTAVTSVQIPEKILGFLSLVLSSVTFVYYSFTFMLIMKFLAKNQNSDVKEAKNCIELQS